MFVYRVFGWLVSVATFPGILVHEYAHKLFCNICGVPVFEVSYFNPFQNPMGYVLHAKPSNLGQQFWITVGPLIVNSIVCLIVGLLFTGAQVAGLMGTWPDLLALWLPVSLGMHAFPSLADARSLWSQVNDDNAGGYLGKLLMAPVVLVLMVGSILSVFWLDVAYGMLLGVTVPQQVMSVALDVVRDPSGPSLAMLAPTPSAAVVDTPDAPTPVPTPPIVPSPTALTATTPAPKQQVGPFRTPQRMPEQATPPGVSQRTPAPDVQHILSGPLEGGLRIGTVEWVPLGYTLVDYARKVEVQMLFHSLRPSETASLDTQLVVDGDVYRPLAVRIAEVDVASNTHYSELEVRLSDVLALERGLFILVTVTFDTPVNCMTAGEQKDACMRSKDVLIRLPAYNVQGRIQLFTR